jgi:DNA primase
MATSQSIDVLGIIQNLGIEIVHNTDQRFNCYCPFHNNTDSPAFSIDRYEGLWICFNEGCGESGNLEQLIMKISHRTEPEAMRYMYKHSMGSKSPTDFLEMLEEQFEKKDDLPLFPQQVVDETVRKFWDNPKAMNYMAGRGFGKEVLKSFQVGYTNKSGGQITVPLYSPTGSHPVGMVGRCIDRKMFDNSKGLPRNHTLFNLSRARRISSTCVIVESAFDAMSIEQAGFANVVAFLGSVVSQEHCRLLEKNFSKVIIFSDDDAAGVQMRKKLEAGLNGTAVLHASAGYGILYPSEGNDGERPKDAGNLSPEQITTMIKNAKNAASCGVA